MCLFNDTAHESEPLMGMDSNKRGGNGGAREQGHPDAMIAGPGQEIGLKGQA